MIACHLRLFRIPSWVRSFDEREVDNIIAHPRGDDFTGRGHAARSFGDEPAYSAVKSILDSTKNAGEHTHRRGCVARIRCHRAMERLIESRYLNDSGSANRTSATEAGPVRSTDS